MVILETMNRADPWECRVAIASALNHMAPLVSQTLISPLFNFLIGDGALGDRHAEVRKTMLGAATSIIDLHGAQEIASLMKMFEDYLGQNHASTETDDNIKEAVVIVCHLDRCSSRQLTVFQALWSSGRTPRCVRRPHPSSRRSSRGGA